MKKVLAVIPARIGSTRIPRKMLVDIGGKTLIQRTYERSKNSKLIDELIIATDSEEIFKHAESFGARVIMTSSDVPTGTDRVGEVLENFTDFEPEIIVNIWGDEPMFDSKVIDDCIELLQKQPDVDVVAAADRLKDEKMIDADSFVKIVTDDSDKVLYLSRARIPFHYNKNTSPDYFHIIGVMAWRSDFFKKFLQLPQSPLEKIEGVEQLRIIDNGFTLKVLKGDFNNIGVNTLEDLDAVRKICDCLN